MPAAFKDHFSERSDDYAAYRPTYPAALFNYLQSVAPARRLAWDCATGSGQVALALAEHFDSVIATDASKPQIDAARPHPKVDYRVAAAESSELETGSVDLATVGQAFHWFDATGFFDEAQRVVGPNGVLAIWCYETCTVSVDCDRPVRHLYTDLTGPYWPPERALIEEGFASVVLPGTALDVPEFEMSLSWTANDMLGYLRTWSACKRFEADRGTDPVLHIEDELRAAWGDTPRTVTWPLRVRVSRLNTVD